MRRVAFFRSWVGVTTFVAPTLVWNKILDWLRNHVEVGATFLRGEPSL
jgi:hypothetical protein